MMKAITVAFCLLAVGQMGRAQGAGQQLATMKKQVNSSPQASIAIHFSHVSLKNALDMIAEKMGVGVSYKTNILPSKVVSYQATEASVWEVLKEVLKGTDLYATASPDRKTILVKRQVNNITNQLNNVSGTVTDAQSGDALPGVNIQVKGKTIGTTTDSVGYYSLQVPSPSDTLVYSYIGYQQKVVPVSARSKINVELKQSVISGENMVVTAFGEERNKVSVVGAVQSIKSPDETLKIPSSSLTNAFAGRMAGVTAFQRSGEPGANASQFYIRGISTFSGATQPLIIIDGVEASSGDLNALSPEIIDSFSILKDATATAVYGSRGANGVMIVKTKTGENLKHPKIYVEVENSLQTPREIPNFVDGVSYMNLYNEAIRARNSGEIPYSQDKIRGTREGGNKYLYPNVDWYNTLFKKHTMRQRANVNILGGGKKVHYFMSGSFSRNIGMLKSYDLNSYNNNVKFRRFSFQNNLDLDATPTTTVSLKLNTQLRYKDSPAESANDAFADVMNGNPVDFPATFPKSYAPDAAADVLYGGKLGGRFHGGFVNPFGQLTNGYTNFFSSNVVANVQLQQNLKFITKGLSFKGLASFKNYSNTTTQRAAGYDQFYVNGYTNTEDTTSYDLGRVGPQQDLTLGTNNSTGGNRSLYIQARVNYDKQITAKQHVSAMALYSRTNYNENTPGDLIASLPDRTMGYAGRVSYSYNDTYLAEFNFGYNGTANFAKNHRFGFFPSVAVGYVISNQKFWKPLKSSIDLLKFRASWGKVGNSDIGGARFVYQSNVNLTGRCFRSGRDQGTQRCGASFNRYANPDIQWEVGKKLNLGMDLELVNSLSLNVNFFRNNRTNIFLTRNGIIPSSFGVGGTAIYGNLGTVLNKGMDANINYSKSFSRDFYMALKGTFSYAHNTVTDQQQPPSYAKGLNPEGYPVNGLRGYQAEHLFIDQAEINHSATQKLGGNVMPGDVRYKDVDGNGKIDLNDNAHMGYPSVPEIEYGFGPSFKYKNFDFSFLIQGVAHTSFFMGGFTPFNTGGAATGSAIRNVMQFIADSHWSPDNQDIYASYPRLSIQPNANNQPNSSYWLRNGSYIQLKSAEIGYTYKEARFYFSGSNLLKLSKFKLWDPELANGNGLSYPLQRIINFGVQLHL